MRDGARSDLVCVRRTSGAAFPHINKAGPSLGTETKKRIQKTATEARTNPPDIRPATVSVALSLLSAPLYHAQIISLQESRAETPFFKADKHIECKLPKLHRK